MLNPDRLDMLRPQYERAVDALTSAQQREALIWMRLIVHEAYHLIYITREGETTNPMSPHQLLDAVEHLLAHGELLINDAEQTHTLRLPPTA
jgi:hypothetical protein